MQRRNFLQALIAMVGTTTMPATGMPTTGSSKQNIAIQKPLQILETSIAGFQYYEGERLFPQLNPGDLLQLRRAAENKYDKRAVEVYWQGNMLGHIPKIANMSVSQMMDRNMQLSAHITTLTPAYSPWQCITLIVEWN